MNLQICFLVYFFSFQNALAEFGVGAPLLPDHEFLTLKSGYRQFNLEKTQKYAGAYKVFIDEAATKDEFEEFMKAIEKGSSFANEAVNPRSVANYGILKRAEELDGREIKKFNNAFAFEFKKGFYKTVNDETKWDFQQFALDGLSFPPKDKNRSLEVVSGPVRRIKRIAFVDLANGESIPALEIAVSIRTDYNSKIQTVDEIAVRYILRGEDVFKVGESLKTWFASASNRNAPLEAKSAIIKMADLIRKTVPYVQGSSGIADALVVALFKKNGWHVGALRLGIGTDLKSWALSTSEVVERYDSFYLPVDPKNCDFVGQVL